MRARSILVEYTWHDEQGNDVYEGQELPLAILMHQLVIPSRVRLGQKTSWVELPRPLFHLPLKTHLPQRFKSLK